jgi:hypothetical protein
MQLYTIVQTVGDDTLIYDEPLDGSSSISWSATLDITLCYSTLAAAQSALDQLLENIKIYLKKNSRYCYDHTIMYDTYCKFVDSLEIVPVIAHPITKELCLTN